LNDLMTNVFCNFLKHQIYHSLASPYTFILLCLLCQSNLVTRPTPTHARMFLCSAQPSYIYPRPMYSVSVHGQPTEALVSARSLFLLFYVGIAGLLSASVFGFIASCSISLFVVSKNQIIQIIPTLVHMQPRYNI
jgi:hypothetical protein